MTASPTQESPPRPRVVIYEGNGARPLEDDRRLELLTALLDGGHCVTRPASNDAVAPADEAPHVVFGRFEGDTAATLTSNGLDAHDVEALSADDVLGVVAKKTEAGGATAPGAWKPWFPVIDYDRCTNCMQCLTFCLFDVYGVDQGQQIEVQKATNCKTDCPACSRVCPEAAILFPKYKKGPINGAPVTEDDLKNEAMKADISALLGGDLYKTLRERSAGARERFSTERDDSKALLERKRCLKELGRELDIPDEVLMTLPSVEDIESRAERAKAKADKRRARSQTLRDEQDRKPPPSADDWDI